MNCFGYRGVEGSDSAHKVQQNLNRQLLRRFFAALAIVASCILPASIQQLCSIQLNFGLCGNKLLQRRQSRGLD